MLVSVLVLTEMSADERYVAAPGLACIIMTLWLYMKLWDHDEISNDSNLITVTDIRCV